MARSVLNALMRIAVVAGMASPGGYARSYDYSVEATSPEVPGRFVPADLVLQNGALVHVTAAELGLGPGDEIDALSYALDQLDGDARRVQFSVSRGTVGAGGEITLQQSSNGAAGDKFNLQDLGGGLLGPFLASDAPTHGLTPGTGATQSELDGLAGPASSRSAVYFSLSRTTAPALGFDPADILVVETPGSTPIQVFASRADLGLQVGDNIDALALSVDTDLSGPGTIIAVSLDAASPSRPGLLGPGDGVLQVIPGPPSVLYASAALDLSASSTDELDALQIVAYEVFFPPPPPPGGDPPPFRPPPPARGDGPKTVEVAPSGGPLSPLPGAGDAHPGLNGGETLQLVLNNEYQAFDISDEVLPPEPGPSSTVRAAGTVVPGVGTVTEIQRAITLQQSGRFETGISQVRYDSGAQGALLWESYRENFNHTIGFDITTGRPYAIEPAFDEGNPSCDTCQGYDHTSCGGPDPLCGDGKLDVEEVCDPSVFPQPTDCATLGFAAGGFLQCNADCSGFDTTACTGTSSIQCGNGILEPGIDACTAYGLSAPADQCNAIENCDGANFGSLACQSYGFSGGSLSCSADCKTIDFSTCTGGTGPVCGNSLTEPSEACELASPSNLTCADFTETITSVAIETGASDSSTVCTSAYVGTGGFDANPTAICLTRRDIVEFSQLVGHFETAVALALILGDRDIIVTGEPAPDSQNRALPSAAVQAPSLITDFYRPPAILRDPFNPQPGAFLMVAIARTPMGEVFAGKPFVLTGDPDRPVIEQPTIVLLGPGVTSPEGTFIPILNDPSGDGYEFAFAGSSRGVYLWRAGTLETIADRSTPVPGDTGTFSSFFDHVSLDQGRIAFRGVDAFSRNGIWTNAGGALAKVVTTGDIIGGKTVTAVELGRHGLKGNLIAWRATFDDFSSADMATSVPTSFDIADPSVRDVFVDIETSTDPSILAGDPAAVLTNETPLGGAVGTWTSDGTTGTLTLPGAFLEGFVDSFVSGATAVPGSFSDVTTSVDIATGDVVRSYTGQITAGVVGNVTGDTRTGAGWTSPVVTGGVIPGTMPGFNVFEQGGQPTNFFCTESYSQGGFPTGCSTSPVFAFLTPTVPDPVTGLVNSVGPLSFASASFNGTFSDVSGDQRWLEGPQLCPDFDSDGVCDSVDNCPYYANPGQGPSDRPDRGAACRCGDPDLDGSPTAADRALIRNALAGLTNLSRDAISKCSMFEAPGQCGLVTSVAIARLVVGSSEPGDVDACPRGVAF